MSNAELRDQRVDGAELHAVPTAVIPQVGSIDVIFAVRNDVRQGCEMLEQPIPRSGTGVALQDFLQHQPRADD